MSLENAPTLADCFAVSSEITASTNANTQPLSAPDANESTLESVLADRLHVWTKVTEVIERLGPMEAYQGDVHALQKLLQLHVLCNILSNAALFDHFDQASTPRRTVPRVEAVKTIIPSDNEYGSANEDDIDIDPPNANHIEWQEEQERHLDIADYDTMDLIELSEHFS
ncbi:hypothetical protein PC129_g13741 [Phytophthora cactorum]|uniref:Uncharacterized protein n=1 Tax=Phytophthora cactorum TaxID=29920 RepID=A0A8T1BLM9_9STRA|nr:hypothetical protein Pcac1_g24128 [Phytophthora cactorum]KAG2891752.1 hypothetical protein PC114_g16894 [Phytophthora cactorum]KAG2906126.1 hypothetical protein PC115_g14372 [Phytophthora cactorum]KAG3052852.1 hypothetical protein PC121_g17107 [Phytophthora cactorum]KAG3073013.1 hypothetical protein PC122_g14986 [Phytophthora cactorum]